MQGEASSYFAQTFFWKFLIRLLCVLHINVVYLSYFKQIWLAILIIKHIFLQFNLFRNNNLRFTITKSLKILLNPPVFSHFFHCFLQIYNFFQPPHLEFFSEIYLITELMQSDLHKIIVSPQQLSADHIKVNIYLSIFLFVHLSIYLSICLSELPYTKVFSTTVVLIT